MNYGYKTVTIPAKEYFLLLRNEIELNALRWGGVDNWIWYGEHYDTLKEEHPDTEDIDEIIDMLADEQVQRLIDSMNEVR